MPRPVDLTTLPVSLESLSRLRRMREVVSRQTEPVDPFYGPPSSGFRGLTPKQIEVERLFEEGHRNNLLVGGARSGKTFEICRHILKRAIVAPYSRHAILRFKGNAARASIWLNTLPQVRRLCYPNLHLQDHRIDGYISLPNGSEVWIGGLDEKDRVEKILGNEYATIYLNEGSQIPYSSVLVALTRLAQVIEMKGGGVLPQQFFADLNPVGKSHWSHRLFIQHIDPENARRMVSAGDYVYRFVNPTDNAINLTPEYLASLEALPERYRRRFFDGVYVDEVEGALWTMESLDHCRATPDEVPRTLERVVIGVDPSGTAGDEDTRSNEVGIVVAGRDTKRRGYVLADLSCQLAPEGWGRTVVAAYRDYGADRIVAEVNYGGDMVRAVIDAAARSMGMLLPPVEMVTATRGKAVRAEPISVLYGYERDGEWQRDQVRHVTPGEVNDLAKLEEELLNFSTAGYLGPKSPNRADAYVWAMTDLMLGEQGGTLWSRQNLILVQ